MKAVEDLKKEHELIDRELIELEAIMDSNVLHMPNLLHVFKNLTRFWADHEKKEQKLFPYLKKIGVNIPIQRIIFEHGALKQSRDALTRAIESGSEFKIRQALKEHGSDIIGKLRAHMEYEDEILHTTPMPEISARDLKKLGF